MKKNLPVIIFKEIVFLPKKHIKLEIDNEESKNIINTATYFNNSEVFIITGEENNISNIGVISKIVKKETVANGNMHIEIKGIKRGKVVRYLKQNSEILESIVEEIDDMIIKKEIEIKLVENTKKKIKEYVNKVPKESNSLLEVIENQESLSNLVDIAVSYLQIKDLKPFLLEISPIKRMNLLLHYMNKEISLYEIEMNATNKVEENIQKDNEKYLIKEKIKQLQKEIKSDDNELSYVKEKIKNKNIPDNIIKVIEKEIKRYESLSENSPERGNIKNYIDTLLSIPFGVYTEDNKDLKDVKNKLDKNHYALFNVKERIIEFLALKTLNNNLESPIICLIGPPGVGKTTLARSIAYALNRSFVKMSAGGINDESEFIGHKRTYLESKPGKIINLIKKSKTMNPVFLIDEIDKMVKNGHGDPISTLLDILDTNQNCKFTDNYIDEEIDLSKVFFITTANDIKNIPNELKDRLEFINVEGYTYYEKLEIVRNYILPKLFEKYKISADKINFDDKAIIKIINEYTKELGIRNLERKIEEIVRKIITEFVVYKNVKNKYYVTENIVSLYLGKPLYEKKSNTSKKLLGTANAIAYTTYGGDVLPIEATYFKGSGKIILTGTLGDVLKESALISLSYLRSNADKFKINIDMNSSDIHIHIPNADEKKDGPSAGITITTALLSIFTKTKINNKYAFTGEMTLSGKILPVGKIKEKVIAAYRNNIEIIFVPKENKQDIDDLPNEIVSKIKFIYVDDYKEIYDYLVGEKNGKNIKRKRIQNTTIDRNAFNKKRADKQNT